MCALETLRANFNEMWQSMVCKFNEGKKYIIDLIDQSTLAYDQREELCNKLQVLKERNENDKIMHIQVNRTCIMACQYVCMNASNQN